MAQTPGAYRLGKAILDKLQESLPTWDIDDKGNLVKSSENTHRALSAIRAAAHEAGFVPLGLALTVGCDQ